MKSVESLKQILKDSKGDKTDLYSHLLEVFNTIILHYPDDALEKLEEVSWLTKNKQTHTPEEWLVTEEFWNFTKTCENKKEFIDQAKKYFELPAPEEEGGPPGELPVVNHVPDLQEASRVLEYANVSLGRAETARLQKSLSNLSAAQTPEGLKFWGIIRGTKKDYYIAEGKKEAEEEGIERGADFEARGTQWGVNEFAYWVSSGPMSEWTLLPDLEPKDLAAARSIKVLFEGDLERKITTNPFFFKEEKFYLRAQIARISHGTTVIPRGVWKLAEAEEDQPALEIEPKDPENEEDQFKQPETEDQVDLENWVHFPKSILLNNRTGHLEPEPEEGDEREPADILKEIVAKDPYDERLKPVTEDSGVDGTDTAWTVKLLGPKSRQTVQGKMGKTSSAHYGVVVLKSLRWPGSVTCWKGQ